jgi:hypothetical protein
MNVYAARKLLNTTKVLNKKRADSKKRLVPGLWPTTIGFAEFAVVSLLGGVRPRIRIEINPAMKIEIIMVVRVCHLCLIVQKIPRRSIKKRLILNFAKQ